MEKSKFSLRKDKPEQMTEVLGNSNLGSMPVGRMPMRVGEIILSDGEKRDLRDLGYVEGDAIPTDLAEKLSGLRKQQAEEFMDAVTQLEKTQKRLIPKEPVPISKLSKAKQEELRKYKDQAEAQLKQFQETMAQRAEIDALPDPGLRQAAYMASQPVTVTRGGVKTGQEPEKPQSVSKGQPEALKGKEDILEDSDAEPDLTTGAVDHIHCQHCNWPLNTPEPATPTPADYIDYKAASLGGYPYSKGFSLFNDAMFVYYRNPPVKLSEMALRQLSLDRHNGRILDDNDLFRLLGDYRLIISLYKVTVGTDILDVAEEVDGMAAETPATLTSTPLLDLLERIQENPVFSSETNWRLFGKHMLKFNDLVQVMEARADDPSFY